MLHFYSHGSVIRNNIYSHGILEGILNNDLLYGKKDIPVGINDCIVDDYYECTCYSWKRSLGQCALVCLKDDISANKFAFEKYINKAEVV